MTNPNEDNVNDDCLCARCQAHRAALRFERAGYAIWLAQHLDDGESGECLGPAGPDPWPLPPEV